MLHYFALFAATVAVTTASAAAPQWESDYATALAETRANDRPLLMVIDEPQVADKAVSADVLANEADGALADYDLCHVDASTSYGAKVAKAFGAKSFPFVAFVDKDGKVILHQQAGKISADTWTNLVTKYRTGERPVRHIVSKPVIKATPVSSASPYMPQAKPYCAKCQRGY
ncbi:hypothetical protein [Aeoliella sp. SH292]|uniref:hypothetical protein n=1 Tax=Aeoliella sp. SH292 TaxID=3454464 RepID=UPI003F9A015C